MNKWFRWVGLFVWVVSGVVVLAKAESVTNNLDVQDGFVYNHAIVNPGDLGLTFTNDGVRDVTVSVGQLSGVDPQSGAVITNAANLLPLKAQSLTVVSNVTVEGIIYGDGSGLTDIDVTTAISNGAITSDKLSSEIPAASITVSDIVKWDAAGELVDYVSATNGAVRVDGLTGRGATVLGATCSVDGVLAQYPFSGNADDLSGNGYNGTVYGASLAPNRFGAAGSAYMFDGVNDYIRIGSTPNVPVMANYAVSIWFMNDGDGDFSNYGQKLIDKTDYYHDFYFSVLHSGSLRVHLYDSGNVVNITDNTYDYRDSQWHHAVVSKSDNVMSLWVDGELFGTVSNAMQVSNSSDLLIGYSDSSDSLQRRYWSGGVDDIRVFDRALSDSEIVSLYSAAESFTKVDGDLYVSGNVNSAGTFFGDGSGLTNLNVGLISAASLPSSVEFGSLTVQSNLVVGTGSAMGLYAVAEGYLTSALGNCSHAEGRASSAEGSYSHAEGGSTTASGYYSHAEGVFTIADGYASHAAGRKAYATNDLTYVWSDNTVIGSTAEKQFTVHASNGIRLLGGPIEGDGSGLTNLPGDQITGTIPVERIAEASTNTAGLLTAADKQKLNNLDGDYLKLDGTTPMAGTLDLDGNKITGLDDAATDTDAASQGHVKTMMQQVPEYGDLSMGEFTSQVALPNRPIPTVIDAADLADGAVSLEKMDEIQSGVVVGNLSGGYAQPTTIEVKDEDDLFSDSSTALATQQSIKKYVDEKFVQGVFSGDVIFNGSIQSPDFVTGVSGWRIDSNGDAEFNNSVTHGYVIPTPTLVPSGGNYLNYVNVQCVHPSGTVVRFTRDGSAPTSTSEIFPTPPDTFLINDSETLVVAAFDTFTSRPSQPVVEEYKISPPLAVCGSAPFGDEVWIRSYRDTQYMFVINDVVLFPPWGLSPSEELDSSASWVRVSRQIYINPQGQEDGYVYRVPASVLTDDGGNPTADPEYICFYHSDQYDGSLRQGRICIQKVIDWSGSISIDSSLRRYEYDEGQDSQAPTYGPTIYYSVTEGGTILPEEYPY